jgi:FKBP-type peptidyl-prolyl cis-trans isomerase FkpA
VRAFSLFFALNASLSLVWAQAPASKPTTSASKPATPARKPAARPAAKPATASKPAAAIVPMTDEEKTIYAIGLSVARSLNSLDLSPTELDVVIQALKDNAAKKPAVNLQEWGPKIPPFARARAPRVLQKEKADGQAYAEKALTQPGATKTDSGIVYREITPGTGASPQATDTVKVNYRGTLIDGTEFDSSYKRNQPASFPLNGVIPCWTEGMQKMKVGGKSVLVCPSDLAYKDQGNEAIPGGATLIFEIELLDVTPGAK